MLISSQHADKWQRGNVSFKKIIFFERTGASSKTTPFFNQEELSWLHFNKSSWTAKAAFVASLQMASVKRRNLRIMIETYRYPHTIPKE